MSCMLLTTLKYGYICLVWYWLHWSTDTFVLYVTDYTGVRIYLTCTVPDYTGVRIHLSCMFLTTRSTDILSCMLRTTLKYGYICLVWYWLHWSTDTFVLYVTDYTGVRIYLPCVLLKTNVSVLQCRQEQTRQMYPYSSVVRNRTKQMYPDSNVVMYRTR
jgi:GR25 family glycosyltransferase involved in LPS biosynthesis